MDLQMEQWRKATVEMIMTTDLQMKQSRTSTSVATADRPRIVHTRHPILAIYCFIRFATMRDP